MTEYSVYRHSGNSLYKKVGDNDWITVTPRFNPMILDAKRHKKISRRICYEVSWWTESLRETRCFYSAVKMRSFVNKLHGEVSGRIEIDKVWCYREHSPRHKWFFYSDKPGQFVCQERY